MARVVGEPVVTGWGRLGIALIPLTAVAGPYLLPIAIGGISLYAFRVLVLVGVPAVFLARAGRLRGDRTLATLGLCCGGLWIAWGLSSLAWARDVPAAIVDIMALGVGWATVALVSESVGHSAVALGALRRGWIAGLVLAVAVAGWELVTRHHLQSSLTERAPTSFLLGLVPISTFGNPNNLAAFLLLVGPILAWEIAANGRWAARCVALLGILTAIGLSVLASARLAMLGFVGEAAILVVAMGVDRRYRRGVAGGLMLLACGVATLLFAVPEAATDASTLLSVSSELASSGAAPVRMNLIRSGMLMIENSLGFGVGAGNFPDAILRGESVGYTGGIVNPHNFGIEILSQYGVVVAAAFLAFMMVLVMMALARWRQAVRQRDPDTKVTMAVLIAMLLGYIFAASENSAYINQPVNWAMIGTMVAMLNVARHRATPGAGANIGREPREGLT